MVLMAIIFTGSSLISKMTAVSPVVMFRDTITFEDTNPLYLCGIAKNYAGVKVHGTIYSCGSTRTFVRCFPYC